MLAALDQQCVARIVGIVEKRVVAQSLARDVAAVDDHVRRHRDGPGERHSFALPAGHRQRHARFGHGMQVEQIVDSIV